MYGTILATSDGSDGARRPVERAIELASLFNGTLHLLHVVDVEEYSADKPAEAVDSLLDEEESAGEVVLDELEALARESSVDPVHATVRRGVPHEEILDYADDHQVELVVMGVHGESGYESGRLGSTAEEVARRIDGPLLLV